MGDEMDLIEIERSIIKKHRKEFSNDKMIQEILDNSRFMGFENGYLVIPFEGKFLTENELSKVDSEDFNLEDILK